MSGSFTISRSLWDDAAFQDEPFSEREAWIWMIAEAKWKPQEKRVGSAVVQLDRGQFAHSTRFLADAWKWSHTKARRFLERLENRHMIKRQTGTGVSVITICKYSNYQLSPSETGTAPAQQPAQHRHSTGTNLNKGNKGNKEEDMGKPISPAGKPPDKMRLPDDWALSEEGWAYARSQNIPEGVIEDEAKGFHAYWTDRRDRDAKKSARGWEQCWANRCRTIAGRYAGRGMAGKASPGGYGQGGSMASIVLRRHAQGEY